MQNDFQRVIPAVFHFVIIDNLFHACYHLIKTEEAFIAVEFMNNQIFQPFEAGTMGSQTYRIPAIYTLHDGTVLAAADMRYNHGADSPNNIDTLLAFSDDGYSEWRFNVVNYFDDYVDTVTAKASASFIDTAIVQTEKGRIFILTDLWTSDGGYMTCKKGTGFVTVNGKEHLLLTTGSCSDKIGTFRYYIGDYKDGFAPVMRLTDNTATEYSVDEDFCIYKNNEALYQKQEGSDKQIKQNVYYDKSYFSAYRTCYLWLRYSDDNGKTWSKPMNISSQIKKKSEGFVGVGPGRGATVKVNGKERILFTLYRNGLIKGSSEEVVVIYSDDNGKTWHRADTKHGFGVGKTSESQIVNLPDGKLRIYARNKGNYISFSDSTDGGETWTKFIHDKNLPAYGNCMSSFINYSRKIKGKNVIIGSFPSDIKKRANGIIAVGLVGENNKVDWINKYKVNEEFFAYSCLTELKDGNIAFLYEDKAANITYKIYSLSDDGDITPFKG